MFYFPPMNTVAESRRVRLRMLVEKHEGMANLCELLGYARNETATLTRVLNANVRHDRGGKPYNMGTPTARRIEKTLNLSTGWMDTPPTYAELTGSEDPRALVLLAMEKMPDSEVRQLLRFADAVQQPPPNSPTHPSTPKNGTTG